MCEAETERERQRKLREGGRKKICKMESGRQVERKNERTNERMKNKTTK
jgi:hypothetical protein